MEILNVTTETTLPWWSALIIVVAVAAIIGLTACWVDALLDKLFSDNINTKKIIIEAACCLVLIAVIVVVVNVAKEKYRVVETKLSDEVSYKEIISKYELKEIRGNIYVFREKDRIK